MSVLLKSNIRGLNLISLLKEDGEVDLGFKSGCGYIDVSFHRFIEIELEVYIAHSFEIWKTIGIRKSDNIFKYKIVTDK